MACSLHVIAQPTPNVADRRTNWDLRVDAPMPKLISQQPTATTSPGFGASISRCRKFAPRNLIRQGVSHAQLPSWHRDSTKRGYVPQVRHSDADTSQRSVIKGMTILYRGPRCPAKSLVHVAYVVVRTTFPKLELVAANKRVPTFQDIS